MPKVGKKKFSYTKKGKRAAKKLLDKSRMVLNSKESIYQKNRFYQIELL